MAKRVAARPHGIEFTDADWERVKAVAERHDIKPSTLINQVVGMWYKGEWDGLTTHGGRREGSGRKKVKKVILDNQDAT